MKLDNKNKLEFRRKDIFRKIFLRPFQSIKTLENRTLNKGEKKILDRKGLNDEILSICVYENKYNSK